MTLCSTSSRSAATTSRAKSTWTHPCPASHRAVRRCSLPEPTSLSSRTGRWCRPLWMPRLRPSRRAPPSRSSTCSHSRRSTTRRSRSRFGAPDDWLSHTRPRSPAASAPRSARASPSAVSSTSRLRPCGSPATTSPIRQPRPRVTTSPTSTASSTASTARWAGRTRAVAPTRLSGPGRRDHRALRRRSAGRRPHAPGPRRLFGGQLR